MGENEAIIEAQRIAMWGTLAAAFIGATIGFLGSWIATRLNAKNERKKMMLQLGYEMGMKHWESIFGHIEKTATKGSIVPPYSYVNFNVRVLELLAENKLTPESLLKLKEEQDKITHTIREFSEKK